MLVDVLQNFFFATGTSLFSWHFLTCDSHSTTLGFVLALFAGGGWVAFLLALINWYQRSARKFSATQWITALQSWSGTPAKRIAS